MGVPVPGCVVNGNVVDELDETLVLGAAVVTLGVALPVRPGVEVSFVEMIPSVVVTVGIGVCFMVVFVDTK